MAEAKPNTAQKTTPAPAAPGPKESPGVEQVTTKAANGREITLPLQTGASLEDMTNLHGDEAVYSHAVSHMRISFQGLVRRLLAQEDPVLTDDDIKKRAAEWKAGVKLVRPKTDADKLLELLSKMDPAEAAKLIAESQKK